VILLDYEFKEGDRVTCERWGAGTIRKINDSSCGVEFDKHDDRLHDLSGICKQGHGLWIGYENLTLERAVNSQDEPQVGQIWEVYQDIPGRTTGKVGDKIEIDRVDKQICYHYMIKGNDCSLSKREFLETFKLKGETKMGTTGIDSAVAEVYTKTEDAIVVSDEMNLSGFSDEFIKKLFLATNKEEILKEAKARKAKREKDEKERR
jgi:hypothetical protein